MESPAMEGERAVTPMRLKNTQPFINRQCNFLGGLIKLLIGCVYKSTAGDGRPRRIPVQAAAARRCSGLVAAVLQVNSVRTAPDPFQTSERSWYSDAAFSNSRHSKSR